jgi:hypothetical protein
MPNDESHEHEERGQKPPAADNIATECEPCQDTRDYTGEQAPVADNYKTALRKLLLRVPLALPGAVFLQRVHADSG